MTDRHQHQREREWGSTEIGKLFVAYENAHEKAWQADAIILAQRGEYHHERKSQRAWTRSDNARAAFLKALRGW